MEEKVEEEVHQMHQRCHGIRTCKTFSKRAMLW